MKKIILSAIMIFALVFSSYSQDILRNTLGLRIGHNYGFGGEISYQRSFMNFDRIEIDLGFRNQTYSDEIGYSHDSGTIKLIGLYQFRWNIYKEFNWYAGGGAGIGTFSNKQNSREDYPENATFALIAGDIGIEYNFFFPLQLSLDFRPELGFGDYKYINNNLSTFGPDIALGIRFKF